MEWYHVYLFTRLDGLSGAFCFSGILLGVITVIALAFLPILAHEVEDTAILKKIYGVLVGTALFFSAGALAIPTQKEAAAIYLLPKLAKSEFASEASKIPTDAAKLLRLKLEQYIADIDPVKEATKK